MRAFIALCLVATVCADKLGYDYKPVDHSSSGLSFTPGGGSGGLDYGSGAASHDVNSFAPQGEVDKEFYTFTANDEDFIQPAASNQYANGGKQSLRVVFIKGPENNGLEDAALAYAKQAASQKTAIYVLNKQPDLNDFTNKLQQVGKNANNKPEVHFVKYRTPEDAANAQRSIQGQYDSLGGPSQHINGGVAPALNYASSAPVGSYGTQGVGSYGPQGGSSYGPQGGSSYGPQGGSSFGPQGSYGAGSSPSGSIGAPSASYLPASFLRRYRIR